MLIRSVGGTRSGALLGLLQEVCVLLGESTASLYWDLLKFYDSIDARPHRVGAECGFPMRVAVVDLKVHSPWVEGTDCGKQHAGGQQVFQCVCEKDAARNPGGDSQVGAVGQG